MQTEEKQVYVVIPSLSRDLRLQIGQRCFGKLSMTAMFYADFSITASVADAPPK